MNHRFDATITASGLGIRLLGPSGTVPFDQWALVAPRSLLPGVELAKTMEANGDALADADLALVRHETVAALSPKEAAALGLPAVADVVARVESSGIFPKPDYDVRLEWRRPDGRPLANTERTGAFLRIGADWKRLPQTLHAVAEAADAFSRVATNDEAKQFTAMANLREVLPPATAAGDAEATGLIGSMTIAVADAFSLDIVGEGERVLLEPILHRAGGDTEARLLPADKQEAFGRRRFNAFATARAVYPLGAGWYVVLSPPLRKALAEVRRVQAGPASLKRALLASPRAFLRQALGDDTDDTVIETLFRDTAAYSERVQGLGLWQPRVLPWIKLPTTDWFGADAKSGGTPPAPDLGGLVIGDTSIEITPQAAAALKSKVETAIGAGEPSVAFSTATGATIAIPATYETLAALEKLGRARGTSSPEAPAQREVLVIRPNEETVESRGAFTPRPSPLLGTPAAVATALKQHQKEGLDWLQRAWRDGRPGVLLADDMGLGKTLQGLAFLAWLKAGMSAGEIESFPILVVAPTGLLRNWRAEHDRHLTAPGLGTCVEAHGKGLARLKATSPDGRPGLDRQALTRADWVLTTYETLRDFDLDFGAVRFAVLLFDEAQKIKTPGTRSTDAAKAMKADFRVALTGTPVENRLADLWCITDTVHPAFFGDLKSFSARYEQAPDAGALKGLKQLLDVAHGGRPPLMLRRLKEDRLPDLPVPRFDIRHRPMPAVQREAYLAEVGRLRGGSRRPGDVLGALQRLRAISLHPRADTEADDAGFIAASARLAQAFEALDSIAAAREKVLIFLDDLTMQARLAGILQRRYRLATSPAIISGEVDGTRRQAFVDRFQTAPDGFDVMVLSPRAGGVGLTLTSANHCIHLSRWWNPAVEDQCTGRIVRIGQERPVHVYFPLAVIDADRPAFDLNLHALLERKRQLMRETLMPPAASGADMDELLRASVG